MFRDSRPLHHQTRAWRRALLPAVSLLLFGLGGAVENVRAESPRPWAAVDLELGAGHDDNILGRISSATTGPDTTLESAFGLVRPSITAGLRSGKFDLVGGYALSWNGFTDDAAGSYQDHLLSLGLRWAPAPRIELGVGGREERFRRTRFDDYDLDHRGGGALLRARPHDRLEVRCGVDFARDAYPRSSQLIFDGSVRPEIVVQVDRPTLVDAEATVHLFRRLDARVGAGLTSTASTVPRFEYDARQVGAGVAWSPGAGFELDCDWVREARDYDRYLVTPPGSDPRTCLRPAARCDHREDTSDSYTLEVRRPLSSRSWIRGSLSRIDYRSNVDGFSFDQTRIRLGLEVRLAAIGAEPVTGALPELSPGLGQPTGPSGLAPRVSEAGVRFFCRAPGAAGVTLVGSFNDWDKSAAPLEDPDGDGVWEITFPLPAGTHRFMFLVDGSDWRRPEDAVMYEDDGFGLTNGIVVVP